MGVLSYVCVYEAKESMASKVLAKFSMATIHLILVSKGNNLLSARISPLEILYIIILFDNSDNKP